MLSFFQNPKYDYLCDMWVRETHDAEFKRCPNNAAWDHNYSKFLMCDRCLNLYVASPALVKPPEEGEKFGKKAQDEFIQELLTKRVEFFPDNPDC